VWQYRFTPEKFPDALCERLSAAYWLRRSADSLLPIFVACLRRKSNVLDPDDLFSRILSRVHFALHCKKSVY
jgi:hypothetical protein